MVQSVEIKKFWKNMLYDSLGRNNIPAGYLSISKNARIKDNTITKRRGYKTLLEVGLDWLNQGITFNKNIFFCAENKLRKVNEEMNNYEEIGELDPAEMYNFINYGKHLIILTWVGKPFVYNWEVFFQLGEDSYHPAYLTGKDKPIKKVSERKEVTDGEFSIDIDGTERNITGLDFSSVASITEVCEVIQEGIRAETGGFETVKFNDKNLFVISSGDLTDKSEISKTKKITNGTGTDISGASSKKYLDMSNGDITEKEEIDAPSVNPIIGETFTWFTFIVWNTDKTENVLYISRPITLDNQERCYDWLGENSETITFDSKILGLSSTMNQLFIFTEKKVEYLGKDSLQTIGDNATLISTPVGDGGKLANYRCAIPCWDKVLYLTNTNSINTLNFVPGTVEPGIGTLTDQPAFKITKYLEDLEEKQDSAFGYYDDSTKTAHWFLKTKNSFYNDTILVFDLENNSRTTDTNKYFNDIVVSDGKVYAGDSLSCRIIQDNIGLNDNQKPIEFEIQDTDISLGTIREKIFQGWEISGGLNSLTNLEIITKIDDKDSSIVYLRGKDQIIGDSLESLPWEIGGSPLGETALGWLQGENQRERDQLFYFDKILDHSYLYKRGKRIKRKITENSYGSDFFLDWYMILADVTGNIELNDKF